MSGYSKYRVLPVLFFVNLTNNEETPKHEAVRVPPRHRQRPVPRHVLRINILQGEHAAHVPQHVEHGAHEALVEASASTRGVVPPAIGKMGEKNCTSQQAAEEVLFFHTLAKRQFHVQVPVMPRLNTQDQDSACFSV